jgi:hypothetical protein
MAPLELSATRVQLDGEAAVFDEYFRRGWTDGLPIIAPTPQRVEAMLDYAGLEPNREVAAIAPRRAVATAEKVAINSVMAGCLPAYFPVVLAAVEAIADPTFNLFGVNTTTGSACVLTVINGPIRNQLDINGGYGCLGPGWRANATIGRAIALVQQNIGGRIPGPISKSTYGQPGRYTMCLGEFEEKNPWQPLHVERGFKAHDSTVTVLSAMGTTNIMDVWSRSAEGILTSCAHSMDWVGSNNMVCARAGESLLVLSPDHAQTIAGQGWSKDDIRRFLMQEANKTPLTQFPKERHEALIGEGRVEDGRVPLHYRPEQFMILVAGGLGGFHALWIPTWGDSYAVTKQIRIPA